MSARCVGLMVSLRDSSSGLEGHKAIEWADEITASVLLHSASAFADGNSSIVSRADRKVNEWAALSRLKSFLQQREIKDGIDSLHRDIDAAMMRFNVGVPTTCVRSYFLMSEITDAAQYGVDTRISRIQGDSRARQGGNPRGPTKDYQEHGRHEGIAQHAVFSASRGHNGELADRGFRRTLLTPQLSFRDRNYEIQPLSHTKSELFVQGCGCYTRRHRNCLP